jgi:hypothetical protein
MSARRSHSHTSTHTYTLSHTQAHTHADTHKHTCTHTSRHTQTHTHMLTRAHTHTHTHAHTHTHTSRHDLCLPALPLVPLQHVPHPRGHRPHDPPLHAHPQQVCVFVCCVCVLCMGGCACVYLCTSAGPQTSRPSSACPPSAGVRVCVLCMVGWVCVCVYGWVGVRVCFCAHLVRCAYVCENEQMGIILGFLCCT